MHFLFFLFSFFPPFSNRPQQEAPAAGGLHLTENSQSCHSEERSDVGISGKMLHRHSGLLKNQSSPKFRREGSCERKPSGYPFASNNPPQRQNCKIMLQNFDFAIRKAAWRKSSKGLLYQADPEKTLRASCTKSLAEFAARRRRMK